MGKVFTKETEDLFLEYRKNNMSYKDISDILSIPEKTLILKQYHINQGNIRVEKFGNITVEWTEELVNTFIGHLKEGLSISSISNLMSLPKTALTKKRIYLVRYKGLDIPSKARFEWTNELEAKLKGLLEINASIPAITRELNINGNIVRNKINTIKRLERNENISLKSKRNSKKAKELFSSCHWTLNEIKHAIKLFDEGMTYKEISNILNKTGHGVHHKILYYQSSLTASRFGEKWSKEEYLDILVKDFNNNEFCKKWHRSIQQVTEKRKRLLLNYDANIRKFDISKLDKQILSIKNDVKLKKEYSNTPRKHYVQTDLYTKLANVNKPILTLLGPTPERYIEMLHKLNIIGDNFIYSHEIDIDVLCNTAKKLIDEKINITFGDIIAAQPKPIMDIDLMCRWNSEKERITTLFNKQKTLLSDKYFLFTISVMGVENLSICSHVKNILYELLNIDYSVDMERITFENEFVDKFIINSSNIFAYRYTDSSPMLNILIKH